MGEQTRVAQTRMFQNSDFPVFKDYRAVLGGLICRMFGLTAAQIDAVFQR